MEKYFRLLNSFFESVLSEFNLEASKTQAVLLDVVVYSTDSIIIYLPKLAEEIDIPVSEITERVKQLVKELNPTGLFTVYDFGHYLRVTILKENRK